MPTTRSCRCAAPTRSKRTWSAKASKPTVYTRKAKASRSRSPTTRPRKAAPRTAALKSRWWVRAANKLSVTLQKALRKRGFFISTANNMNADPQELAKFSELAHRWWDPTSEFKPLHQINPLRLHWIDDTAGLKGKAVLDVGCGGGILAEAMAALGARVKGIDLSDKALKVALLHLLESRLEVTYEEISAEELALREAGQYDVLTCMEMLEHVPDL